MSQTAYARTEPPLPGALRNRRSADRQEASLSPGPSVLWYAHNIMSNLWPDIMRRLLGTAVAVAIAAGVVPLAWFIFNFAFPEVIPLDFGSASFWLAELRWTMALGIGAAAFWGWFENNEPSFGVCRDLEFRAKHTTVLKKGLPEWVKFVDTRFFYATTHLTFLVVVPAVILAA